MGAQKNNLSQELVSLFDLKKSKVRDEKLLSQAAFEAQRDIRYLTLMFCDGIPDISMKVTDTEDIIWDSRAQKLLYVDKGQVQMLEATFVHEAAHLNLFTNRKWNDFIGHAFCSAPLISFMKDYRYFHFEHHRHTGKLEKDPELKFYRAMGVKPSYASKSEVIKVFINDLTGLSYLRGLLYVLKFFGEKRKAGIIEKPTIIENLVLVGWLTLVPFVMYQVGLIVPFLLFWFLPIITLTPLLLRWHSFGEHVRETYTCSSENTLTHQFGFLSTLFLYPINSSYHLEHHLYPQIPWYSLKKFYFWVRKQF